ncbi:hypothetical protein D6C78_02258 [Aureobasidium pullulans]|uniref:R3H domain-containing protein n=1 Tax=Aureobasidium pullulans TaxID=5580 RepID=A0A4T0C1V0_AURPU|nr:hypothetical protein D6C78_02258 [Aureobasidium pullulans]
MSTAETTSMPHTEPQAGRSSNRPPRQRRPRGERNTNPSAQQEDPQSDASNPGRRRRGGGGRGRGARDPLLALRPSSVAPSTQASSVDPSSADASGTEGANSRNQDSRRGRGGARGGRGGARGGRTPANRTVNGRAFGGQLTSDNELQGDATTFVPGQPILTQGATSQQTQPRSSRRRLSKSTAPDIATRTHHDIDNGHYECPICTSEVLRNSKVWSCHTCWTVFHMSCVKKWSQNQGSAAAQQQGRENGEIPPPRQWRCPGCNLPKDTLPKTYTCWCEKEVEPRAVTGLPPHSCGNTCGRERVRKCPHPCQLTCHAGPCPPCTHMGPTQSCFCGKHESTRRCTDTDYENGWSCGEVCGDLMPCGEHECPRPCHEGLCGACEVRVDARCYCGQVEKALLCADRGDEVTSHKKHSAEDGQDIVEEWTGMFACANSCDRAFDCGVHHCQKPCHTQDTDPGHCPRSPDVVSHCPCGKTKLSEISPDARTSCEDPIANCKKPCMKKLSCGHSCEQLCHSGACMPCLKAVPISCRCGRTTSTTICHQGKVEPPQCMRVCRATLNCGRHACDERCCEGERKAGERQAMKRKGRKLEDAHIRPIDDGFEAEHICTRPCGRPLKCGNHFCEDLCHKGPCGSCREAIFDEINCNCGRTVLTPPLPCGTQPPPCRFQCNRPKTCGHPQVQHNCHMDNESCPRCPFLVEKHCMCGKKSLKNQQCWLKDVSCGQVCGRKLKCGSHFCTKPCHREGDCEDAGGRPCQQPCGKPKKACGHPDEAICHAPTACKEEKACTHKIFITCECQAQKQEMRCLASKSSEGNLTKSLPCNEECARLERNRKLALALNIDQEAHVEGGDHVPFSNETLNLYAAHPTWSTNQEREFRVFAAADDEKRLRFKPMTATQRAFIHHLAEDFGLDSESMDPEPHRHVAIFKTPRFVRSPPKTLKESHRIRNAQRLASGKAIASTEAPANQVRANEVGEPFNSFVVVRPRFGLTIEEVRTELASFALPLQFDVEFLPNEEVIIKAISRTLDDQAVDQTLKNAKAPIAAAIAAKNLGTLQLCRTDPSLNITRRETESGVSDGWSRVAAKSAASRRPITQATSSNRNVFAALAGGNKVTFAKKKEKKPVVPVEPVVDDWEAAEIAEEEKEKLASGHNSGAEEEMPKVDAVETELPKIDGAEVELVEAEDNGALETEAPAVESNQTAFIVDDAQGIVEGAEPEVSTSLIQPEEVKEAETA